MGASKTRATSTVLGTALVLASAGCASEVTDDRLEASTTSVTSGSSGGPSTSSGSGSGGASGTGAGAGGGASGGGGANEGGANEGGASVSAAISASAVTSSSTGGPEPPIPPCFPGVTTDFGDDESLAVWGEAYGVALDWGRALVGTNVADLGLLQADATREGPCFVSFRVGPEEPSEDFDAYVLVRPRFHRELIDVDVNVDESNVRLYWRGGSAEIESHPRTEGDRFLLILRDADAELYQAEAGDASWSPVDAATFPELTADVQLAIVHYPDRPAFWIDEVNVLPALLVSEFPVTR